MEATHDRKAIFSENKVFHIRSLSYLSLDFFIANEKHLKNDNLTVWATTQRPTSHVQQ